MASPVGFFLRFNPLFDEWSTGRYVNRVCSAVDEVYRYIECGLNGLDIAPTSHKVGDLPVFKTCA